MRVILQAFLVALFLIMPFAAANAACTSPAATIGSLNWNSTAFQFCDGTAWQNFGGSQWSNGASSVIYYNAGNVGIGTTSPGSALDVKGTLRLSGSTSGFVGIAPAASAGSSTYTLPDADGTSGYQLTTNGSGTLSWAAAGSSSGDVQTFTSNGTWTKPGNGTIAKIECWGGGGGGGKGNGSSSGSGGGGGAYNSLTKKLSALASTVTVTIGTAGAATATAGANGGSGSVSSFGTSVYAYGGLGGGGTTSYPYGQGGPGGSGYAAATSMIGGPEPYIAVVDPINGGNLSQGVASGSDGTTFRYAQTTENYGGGGGGGYYAAWGYGAAYSKGANSINGGAGGGGGINSGVAGVGGMSTNGGNGGAGGAGGVNGTAGSVPGGGGGGTSSGTSGAGAAGKCEVVVW